MLMSHLSVFSCLLSCAIIGPDAAISGERKSLDTCYSSLSLSVG
jgi:hypothetical protein